MNPCNPCFLPRQSIIRDHSAKFWRAADTAARSDASFLIIMITNGCISDRLGPQLHSPVWQRSALSGSGARYGSHHVVAKSWLSASHGWVWQSPSRSRQAAGVFPRFDGDAF